ncbi:YciI family protein [Acidihalobacter prosperus]|uniref:YCII-related domain-containing protein n=1 Tax=Acidihalobacter prosperus TaxID=160660 RepID=A0A1A6C1C0_9GAMM|nr:YciI family protein [Acidihalobacter prosperus]OBS08344.1 hypothetical protein Thpro_022594 [Acidihalobacter prosperus]
MRFMIIVKATQASEEGRMPGEALIARMAEYHEALAQAGMLLDASGLQPSSQGWRVRYAGGECCVVDGPFAENRELIAGYTLIEADSRETAIEWSRRYPNPTTDGGDCEIEVRPLMASDDFEAGDAIERFRVLEGELQAKCQDARDPRAS